MNDPEIWQLSILSLGKIVNLLIPEYINPDEFYNINKIFLKTINDYTLDKWGDIGMIVWI